MDGHYLNNSVSVKDYRQIVAPQKFHILKTSICPRSGALRANTLVLRTSNFPGATIRPIVPRHKHSIVFIVHHSVVNNKDNRVFITLCLLLWLGFFEDNEAIVVGP